MYRSGHTRATFYTVAVILISTSDICNHSVWSLELSVRRAKKKFEVEYGKSIEDFLESIYIAGVDFKESGIEQHAQSIERSYQMLQLVDSGLELLRAKHKYGEIYYWILYYVSVKTSGDLR